MAKSNAPVFYPWDKWFAKKSFKLEPGKDFHCKPHSMLVQVRNVASSRGVSVSTKVRKGIITVTVKE
jgi:hypothetical protein